MTRPSERGVSIPIGNVFMVALAIIVAVVLSVFALNFVGDLTNDTSQAERGFSFSYDSGADELTISYTTGPDTPAEDLLIRGNDPDGQVTFGDWSTVGGNDPAESGQEVTLSNVDGDEKISIVHVSGDSNTVIQSWEDQ